MNLNQVHRKEDIVPLSALYKKNVSRFAPLKSRERNNVMGNIGFWNTRFPNHEEN